MRFFTEKECRDWCSGYKYDEKGDLLLPDHEKHYVHKRLPSGYTRLNWFCRFVEKSLQPWSSCLLWVTCWGVWDENLHLYYRLRQSYGDNRLLNEAPGHFFLEYEAVDMASFLEVMILCGWDVHLLPLNGYPRAFISHDEFIQFASDENNPSIVADFEEGLK